MKHWRTDSSKKICMDRILSIKQCDDGKIRFREECDKYYDLEVTKSQAIAALREAIKWIEDLNCQESDFSKVRKVERGDIKLVGQGFEVDLSPAADWVGEYSISKIVISDDCKYQSGLMRVQEDMIHDSTGRLETRGAECGATFKIILNNGENVRINAPQWQGIL